MNYSADTKSIVYFFKARVPHNFRMVTKHLFKYNGDIYEVNNNNMEFLKNSITTPCKIEICGVSRANIGKIISYLKIDNVDFYIRTIRNKNDKYLRYEIILINKKKQNIKIKKLYTNK